jgi:hypothetical protein
MKELKTRNCQVLSFAFFLCQTPLVSLLHEMGTPKAGTQLSKRRVMSEIDRRLEIADQLLVDGPVRMSPRATYRIVAKNRSEGLEEIITQSAQAELEHSWAFVPNENIWVDITLETEEFGVYEDDVWVEHLRDFFGRIEIYHTHPKKMLERIALTRPHVRFPCCVSGALPTETDLKTLRERIRERPNFAYIEAVVHEYGVSYAVPTAALRAFAGDFPIFDVANRLYEFSLKGRNPFDQIAGLAQKQEQLNVLPKSALPAFQIKVFGRNSLDRIGSWLARVAPR